MKPAQIGLMLAQERRLAGLTQAELATKLGTSQPAVSRVEAGGVVPRLDFLERWAEETGRPITLKLGSSGRRAGPSPKRRVRQVLGDFRFDPWMRNPTAAERRSLEADGLTRDRFKRPSATR
jgi:transcriptional regulator with XRE-family HTH domain